MVVYYLCQGVMGIIVYQLLVYFIVDDEYKCGVVLYLFIGYRMGFFVGCFMVVYFFGYVRKCLVIIIYCCWCYDYCNQYCFFYDFGIVNFGFKLIWVMFNL